MALIEVVDGLLEIDSTAVAGINDFSLDESFDYGEVRNNEHPTYASLIEDQTSWTATLNIDVYADEQSSSASLESSLSSIRTAARNRNLVTVTLTYGNGPSNGTPDFGDLGFDAKVESADAKITSLSTEGTFIADGEVWTTEVEVQGIEAFS